MARQQPPAGTSPRRREEENRPTARELDAGGEEDALPPSAEPSPPVVEAPARALAKAEAVAGALDPPTGLVRYRVWAHGTLQRNGHTHRPGDEISLPADIGDKIVCLERV